MTPESMGWYAARALANQTPDSLAALSYDVDEKVKRLFLKAHFATCPTEADVQDMMDV